MPISIEELPNRRAGRDGVSATRVFSVLGATDSDNAADALSTWLSNAGETTWDGQPIQSYDYSEKSTATGAYDITVRYGSSSSTGGGGGGAPDLGLDEVRISARTLGRTEKVTHSLETISTAAASWFNGGNPVDYEQAINVDKKGQVAGVDILSRGAVYTLTIRRTTAYLTTNHTSPDAYLQVGQTLETLTNSVVYRNRAIGTLLCTSFSMDLVDTDVWEIVVEIEFSPNATGLTFGDITGVAKKGHEYLWPTIRDREVSGQVVPSIAQINVERMYDATNFQASLGF